MLGEWRIGESLGKGTGGSVRLARSTNTGRFAAVKKVVRLPEGHKHADFVHREISLMKLVAPHPHLVQLYDVFESNSHFFLVTEYCPIGELFDYVAEHHLSPFEVQKLFLELVSALMHLRRFRIAHRDIKPENLLLLRDEQRELSLKLADLGLASFQPEDTLLSTSCGSPHYAAPEVISASLSPARYLNVPYDGSLVDVWSSGVVLYAMFTGGLPFDDDNNAGLFHKIRLGEYADHPDLPPVARDLIARCLTVDPNRRYTIEEVAHHPFLRSHPCWPDLFSFAALSLPASTRTSSFPLDAELDPIVISNLRVILKVETSQEAATSVRTNDLARHFYTALFSFRQLQAEQLDIRQPAESRRIALSGSGDTSSENTRSLSAPELALFPRPPSTVGVAHVAQREQLGLAQAVIVQLHPAEGDGGSDGTHTSTGDASQMSYELINRDYIFPPPLSPAPSKPVLPLPTLRLEATTSAPPQIESFSARDLTPRTDGLTCPNHTTQNSLGRTSTNLSSGSGGSRSLPATPLPAKVEPAFLTASRSSENAVTVASDSPTSLDRSVRTRLSMHQRLRGLFQYAAQKRASVSSVLEKARPSTSPGNAPVSAALATPPLAQESHRAQAQKLLKRQPSVSIPSDQSNAPIQPRPTSPAQSTRTSSSSMLKRSVAYPSLHRALQGAPPLSPIFSPELSEFGDILALGASGPGSRGVRELEAAADAREAANKRGAVRIYRDESPLAGSRPQQHPRALATVTLARNRANEVSRRTGGRLVGKPSSSMLRGPSAAQRRATVHVAAATGATARPGSSLTDRENAPVNREKEDPDSLVELHIRTKLATHSIPLDAPGESAAGITGGWRRSSLSIRVPDRPSAPVPVRRYHSGRASTSGNTCRNSCSTSSSRALELENELSLARAENRALRVALDDKNDEASLLGLRAARLLKQVDELERERDELEKQLRRVSWVVSSVHGPRGGGSSIYSRDGGRESVWDGEWLGAHGQSTFQDEFDGDERSYES